MAATLSESLEDYLEAIFHIVEQKRAARATDIGERMGVKASSVTGALRALAQRGLVNYAPYDIVTLTARGEAVAEEIVHRHEVLRDFFVDVLGVEPETADAAACGMEHHVGKVVLRRLSYLARFVAGCPEIGAGEWQAAFMSFCEQREESLSDGAAADGG